MKGFNPSFGSVRFLGRFGKSALEFAIGTGRIALPLAESGVGSATPPVHRRGDAGDRPRRRWGGWNDEPFTADSRRHVSVYEIAA